MKSVKIFHLVALLTVMINCYSQQNYAVIDDPDGYTNVRLEPSIKSQVLGKIVDGEIFWVSEDDESGWCYVNFLQESDADANINDYEKMVDGLVLRDGYVHKSRVRRLNSPEGGFLMNADAGPDNYMMKDSLMVYMKISKYTAPDAVDIRETWGIDIGDGIPKEKIASAYLEINDQRYFLPTSGFFEANFSTTELIYDELMDVFLLTMINSDGAGYYLCAWKVSRNGDVKRYAFRPY